MTPEGIRILQRIDALRYCAKRGRRMLDHMNAHTMRRSLQPFLLLLVGPAFCIAVGLSVIHAWLDARRKASVRHLAHAALRHRGARASARGALGATGGLTARQ